MKLVDRYYLGLKKQAKSSVYHSACLTKTKITASAVFCCDCMRTMNG